MNFYVDSSKQVTFLVPYIISSSDFEKKIAD